MAGSSCHCRCDCRGCECHLGGGVVCCSDGACLREPHVDMDGEEDDAEGDPEMRIVKEGAQVPWWVGEHECSDCGSTVELELADSQEPGFHRDEVFWSSSAPEDVVRVECPRCGFRLALRRVRPPRKPLSPELTYELAKQAVAAYHADGGEHWEGMPEAEQVGWVRAVREITAAQVSESISKGAWNDG